MIFEKPPQGRGPLSVEELVDLARYLPVAPGTHVSCDTTPGCGIRALRDYLKGLGYVVKGE